MNRLIKAVILLTCVMFVGSAFVFAEIKGSSLSNIKNTEELKIEPAMDPVAVITGTDNALYPVQETDGVYEGMALAWEGRFLNFPWRSVASETPSAQLMAMDVTQDGIEDAIVFLTAADGTGVYVEQLHIVDGTQMVEIMMKDPVKAAEEYIQVSTELKEIGPVTVGNYVKYEVKGSTVTATLGVAQSFSQYIGDLVITYQYNPKVEELEAESILYTAF
ncbi:hypothetical protein ACFSVM_04980 [Paenibacillus shunpengii]|uniref:VCBS repeat-containing protein n=1 Tax=Paenibacillus shunpengii TaxID=2054424 RepID=A0ABW5SJ59_9BACL|nr:MULTISPECIES: hypothetical protein [unclassified Paenibacillus]OMC71536.1 hypothetical protein BK126_05515 [Paenibacillus sp. FSL H7-0326]SDW27226.1 hypothetical protein SAMN05518848_101870 [Paenibacillus sp. PDC88]